MGFLLEHLPAAAAPRHQHPCGPRACRCPGCALAASWSRCAPPTCASPATRPASYLNDVHGLDLTPATSHALEARTEGWIAALQLAALSLRGRDDAAALHRRVRRRRPFVVDYLADEVLEPAAHEVRRFLLDTSVLERLTGPLCDAVTGAARQAAGRAGGAGAREPVRRPARRPAPLVPLPPPVRRRAPARACSTNDRTTSPRCTTAPASGTTRPGTWRRRCGTRSPPGRRPCRRPDRARHPGTAAPSDARR